METQLAKNDMVQAWLSLSADLIKLPIKNIWVDYDKEVDVLYLSFRKPQRCKETIETDDDVLIRTDGDEIVGITIMNASTRQFKNPACQREPQPSKLRKKNTN